MYANQNLRNRRLTLGYKQQYMGEQIDISAQAYGKIERGQSRLTKEAAIKFSLVLNIPLEEIYMVEHYGSTVHPLTDKEREFYLKQIQDKEKIIALHEMLLKQAMDKKKQT